MDLSSWPIDTEKRYPMTDIVQKIHTVSGIWALPYPWYPTKMPWLNGSFCLLHRIDCDASGIESFNSLSPSVCKHDYLDPVLLWRPKSAKWPLLACGWPGLSEQTSALNQRPLVRVSPSRNELSPSRNGLLSNISIYYMSSLWKRSLVITPQS